MANEGLVRAGFSIATSNGFNWRTPFPESFQFDLEGTPAGPSPGTITATQLGVQVDLSALTIPAMCQICNQGGDDSNFITYGIWDGDEFAPLGEVLNGESYVIRLSRYLGLEYHTGTGTIGSGKKLMIRSATGNCACYVGAFNY